METTDTTVIEYVSIYDTSYGVETDAYICLEKLFNDGSFLERGQNELTYRREYKVDLYGHVVPGSLKVTAFTREEVPAMLKEL